MTDIQDNRTKRYHVALSISGLDPSGGAGLLADIKTFSALGVYGMAVATALTVQDTLGVNDVSSVEPRFLYRQITTMMDDIMPDATKIGMVNDSDTIVAIADALKRQRPRWIVVDPVMVSSSGKCLMREDAIHAFIERLLPLASLVTPNLPEATRLAELGINAEWFTKRGIAVLVKGGHAEGKIKQDILFHGRRERLYSSPTIVTRNTHGTGCTLSSAIAAYLARGYMLEEAVAAAKLYVTNALAGGADVLIGHGHGSMNHLFHPIAMIKTE